MINIGDTLDNRYRILELIGSGGMADVYEANDFVANKYVAVKILKEEFLNNSDHLKSFSDEIHITAAMSHENIVQVFNEGIFQGRPYIVIEYIKGQDLAYKLDLLGKIGVDEAVDIMIQLLDAMEYIHAHKLIHRDIKPHNIFYLANGTIKLGDFGIASGEGYESNKVVGSLNYLAPEILNGFPFSIRSDIYAAGITFFQLITGVLPFEGKDQQEIAKLHVKKVTPKPSSISYSIPKEIDEIILKATKKNPGERFLKASEFKKALLDYKNGVSKKESLLKKILKNL